MKKEPDGCILPEQSDYPSVILEVGSSESLSQLKVDAELWIEHVPEVRQFVLCYRLLTGITTGTGSYPYLD
jgi:hypothetical protein